MLVICCGMQRSGSTLQYQIASALVEASALGNAAGWDWSSADPSMTDTDRPIYVIKAHLPNPDFESQLRAEHTRYVYCHRDIRDVIVSLIDKYGPMPDHKIEEHVRVYALEPYSHFTRCAHVLVSRYDEMTADLAGEVRRIASFLGVDAHEDTTRSIASSLSLEEQRGYIRRQDWSDGREWDGRTLLHRNHIVDGRTGKWRERLVPRQIDLIHRCAGEWLLAHGYEV